MGLDLVLCAVGFVLLYYGAEWLVKGSSNLARSLGVPPIVIGLTVVAFGTSAPEFVVSVISSVKDKSMIAVGNVFGSNICNIALVLGLAAFLQPIRCHRTVVKRDIPIMLLISLVVVGLSMDDVLTRLEGGILVAGLVLYTIMNYVFAKKGDSEVVETPEAEAADHRLLRAPESLLVLASAIAVGGILYAMGDVQGVLLAGGLLVTAVVVLLAQEAGGLRAGSRLMLILVVIAGIYGVVQGAKTVVDAAERIMYALGVDEKFVGLTIVAFGTSLPELATSVVAALRQEMDISLGNLVGSNVFNLLGVLGVAALVNPITIPGGFVDSGLLIDGLVMLFSSALPWVLMWRTATVGRVAGALLLLTYAGFIVYLVLKPPVEKPVAPAPAGQEQPAAPAGSD